MGKLIDAITSVRESTKGRSILSLLKDKAFIASSVGSIILNYEFDVDTAIEIFSNAIAQEANIRLAKKDPQILREYDEIDRLLG